MHIHQDLTILKALYKNATFKNLVYCLPLIILSSCGDQKAQRIVDDAIEAHGGSAYESFLLEFDFRGTQYTAARNGGVFRYTREFTDSTGRIKDVLDNEGFTRYRNGAPVSLSAERRGAFMRSVNAVIYFTLLPFGLNDDAVIKEWIEETQIEGQPYDLIKVTFKSAGGGDDHQDVFLYWFHKEKHTMDYLAYSYETDGGGLRFRKAVNPKRIGGILLQEYLNYKPENESVPLEDLQQMFMSGTLEKLSEIRMNEVSVSGYRDEN